jgi:hypothetical protein
MPSPSAARLFFAATALAAVVGLALNLFVAAGDEAGIFDTPLARVLNQFTFFTIQTTILVAVACLLLALSLERPSTAFGALRLIGIVGVTVTASVHHTLLAHLTERAGADFVADMLLHTIVPAATVLGWLVFGPRGLISWPAVRWSVAFPAAWGALTLIRGPIIEWYPYPFLDVIDLGYGPALLNGVGIAIGYFVLGTVFRGIDVLLDRRAAT